MSISFSNIFTFNSNINNWRREEGGERERREGGGEREGERGREERRRGREEGRGRERREGGCYNYESCLLPSGSATGVVPLSPLSVFFEDCSAGGTNEERGHSSIYHQLINYQLLIIINYTRTSN